MTVLMLEVHDSTDRRASGLTYNNNTTCKPSDLIIQQLIQVIYWLFLVPNIATRMSLS